MFNLHDRVRIINVPKTDITYGIAITFPVVCLERMDDA